MKFSKVADAGFKVNCIAVDPERKFAWAAGQNGSHRYVRGGVLRMWVQG